MSEPVEQASELESILDEIFDLGQEKIHTEWIMDTRIGSIAISASKRQDQIPAEKEALFAKVKALFDARP